MPKETRSAKSENKVIKNTETEEEIIPTEVIKDLPPETQDKVKEVIRRTSLEMMSVSGHFPSPLLKKINSDHITKMIDYADKDDERNFNYAKTQRNYNLIYFFAFLSLFIFMIVFLIDKDRTLLLDFIKVGLGILGGFGGGYGFKAWKDRKK